MFQNSKGAQVKSPRSLRFEMHQGWPKAARYYLKGATDRDSQLAEKCEDTLVSYEWYMGPRFSFSRCGKVATDDLQVRQLDSSAL